MQQIRTISNSQDKNIQEDPKRQNSYSITQGFTLGQQASPGKILKQQLHIGSLTRTNNSMQNLLINDPYFQQNNSQASGRSLQYNPYLIMESRIVPQRTQKFQFQQGQGLPGLALQVNQGQQQQNSNNQIILQMRQQINDYSEQLEKLKKDQDQQSKKIRILIQENDKLSNELDLQKKQEQQQINEQTKIKPLVQDLELKVHRLILENEKLTNALLEKENIIEEMQDCRVEDTQETDSNQESVFKQNKNLIQRNQSLQRQLETQNSLIQSYKQENIRLQQMLQLKFQLESENLDLKVEIRQIKEENQSLPFKLMTTQQGSPLK